MSGFRLEKLELYSIHLLMFGTSGGGPTRRNYVLMGVGSGVMLRFDKWIATKTKIPLSFWVRPLP